MVSFHTPVGTGMFHYLVILSTFPCLCFSWLTLSEVNLRIEGSIGASQFVEIACWTSRCQIPPHTYKLAFLDSHSLYKIIDLPERPAMSVGELLTVGPAAMNPTIDWGNFVIHLDSPSAVALYYDGTNVLTVGSQATSYGMMSMFAFTMENPTGPLPTNYAELIRDRQFRYPIPQIDLSISLCRHFQKLIVRPTPGNQNACPTEGYQIPDVIINEVNAASPRNDRFEFVEFLNTASMSVHLGNYTVVLYDGETNEAYKVINLVNATLPPGEVFVMGSYRLVPPPDQIFEQGVFRLLQNGADAVALYQSSNQSQYYVGMELTDVGLVDALVYDVRGQHSEILTAVLTPGEMTIHEDWTALSADESLSRCRGTDARNSSQFVNKRRSHGRSNFCDSPGRSSRIPSHMPNAYLSPVVINEFSLEVSNQYIELYDGGIGNFELNSLLVVLYNSRTMRAYTDPVSLTGYKTDPSGYLLVKHRDLASESEVSFKEISIIDLNAIALFQEHSNTIVRGSEVTAENLVDVVVYGNMVVNRQRDLTDILLPGSSPLSMDQILVAPNSYSRCRGWAPMQLSSFLLTDQSPGGRNECPLPQLVINEVDLTVAPEGRFVELLSSDQGSLPLDGIVLVVYERGIVFPSFFTSLDNYATNEAGLLTIGHENGTNIDRVVDRVDWTVNIGALAIYLGSVNQFDYLSSILYEGLVDAVVITSSGGDPDLNLMNVLTPHQNQMNDLDDVTSISRCLCCEKRNSASFGTGPPSPGAINSQCRAADGSVITESLQYHQTLLRINEVYTTFAGNGLYIELYDEGYSGVRMDDLMLSLYSSEHNFYSHYTLQKDGPLGVTDANGFYFIGTPLAGISMNTEVHQSERLLRGTTNAIVLWKDEQQQGEFTSTATVNKEDIIDAVVFSDSSLFDFRTLEMFTSSQANLTANSTFMTGGFSISRCHSRESGDLLGFSFTVPTPGAINNCPMPEIVINEFNVIAFGYDLGEFFEISSLGVPSYPLNNVIVVLYSRQGKIYRTYEINGRRTDSNGLFLLGYDRMKFPAPDMSVFANNGNYIKNGPNGIALHRGKANDFPQRSRMTDDNLIDAVVYGVDADLVVQDLIDVLTPGKPQAFEVTSLSEADESINRCVEEGVAVYRSAHISPKFPNFCPYNDVKVVINEISLDPETQFIEIWDMGISLSSLNNISIVLFNGDGRSYMEIPLNDYRTDSGGYFVIGTPSVTPRSQYLNTFASGFIHTSSGAVALYKTANGYNSQDGSISTTGLLDAMVYADPREPLAGSLVQTLTPQSSPLPSLLLQEDDASISRCFSDQTRTVDVFSVRPNTPMSLNDCPVFETDVVISELNVDQVEDSPDSSDFIELYDGGKGNSSLDGLTLVLFDAGHLDRSYMSVGLDGYRTNAEGYFVIGASTSMENPDISLPSTGFLHRGPDAVAIYRAPSMAFTYGSIAEPQSVVDALVYSLTEDAAVLLETKLTPGYPTFHQRSDYSSSSISRCYGNNRRNPTKFGLADPSPGKPNNCSSATKIFKNIIINEVNIEQESVNSNTEFIELYDLGVGGTSLDGLSLIFFDGDNQDRSYFEVDLNGERTNPDGFFTIGRANAVYIPDKVINYNFLQDGPDAIVLYLRSISDFPRATTATLEGAVDVLVYGSNSDVTSTLIEKLVPGQIQINEQQYHLDGKGSLSRCLSNETMIQSAFITSYLTPGSMNNCTLFPIYINEINFVTTNGDNSDFIELYDGGKGFTALDSLVLVFFSEISSFAFKSLPLQNNQTDINGYFTVGGVDVGSDLTIDSAATWGMLARYPGAVALYRGNHLDYQIGMAPSATNLIDVVILGSKDNPATNLASALSPDQSQIVEEKFFLEGEESVSRCRCCNSMQTSEFGLGPASPRGPNTCTMFNELISGMDVEEEEDGYIVINEISLVSEQGGLLPMEIEILSSSPGRRLDNYVVIYYTSDRFGSSSYLILSLSGEATDEGGYYSLTQDKASRMEKLQHSRGIEGVQAVALYDRRMGQYSYNMQVTDVGLVDAVTFSNGLDDTVKPLQTVLTPPTPAIVTSVAAKNFWASRQPLSLSRCGCCSTSNNSVFTLSSWSPDKPNGCPSADYGTVIQLRLSNAIYSQWISYGAWQMFLKEALVGEVESNCQCGFSLSYFTDEILYEGSVVYEALLMALDERQGRSIVEGFEKFIRENSTITIMDQMFLLDDCTHCILSPRLQRKGKAGGLLLTLLGVVVMSALLVIIVMVARLYRGDLQMLYIKTFKSRGSSDGVKFNNNDGGGLDVNIDDGISNPVYQGSSQDDGKLAEPQFQDPAVNTSGEVPYIVTC